MAAYLLAEHGAMEPLLHGDLDTALSGASMVWAALPRGRDLPNRRRDQPYMRYDTLRSNFDLNRSP